MCLIVFAYKKHPRYNLILAANRDEAFERPTRAAQFWEEYPHVLAGKDLTAGGTWLGINRNGGFAALTNYRDPSIREKNPPTRGKIVMDYVTRQGSPEKYLKELDKESGCYMGFNLLAGTPKKVFHYSNQEKRVNRVWPGIHGLSNHLLDTPWPKIKLAKTGLATAMKRDVVSPDMLFDLLQNDQPFPENELPETGIAKDLEASLSPVFIKTEKYGTRNSTVLLIEKNGAVTFEERRYKPRTTEVDEVNRFEFNIDLLVDS